MASNYPTSGPGCHICLETSDVLKVVTTCGHTFCIKCLSRHIKNEDQASNKFECPSCKVDCPLPQEGVHDLADYEGTEVAPAHEELVGLPNSSKPEFNYGLGIGELVLQKKNVMCKSCWYSKGINTEAKCLCLVCGTFFLCWDCVKVHRRSKATASHEVISFERKGKGLCKRHNEIFQRYCSTCDEPCCFMCVQLDHGDHVVNGIGEMFQALVEEVSGISEVQRRRSQNMKGSQHQLNAIASSEVSRNRVRLIKEVEDHAEKCVTEITTHKTSLIDEIEGKYELLARVDKNIDTFLNIEKLDSTLEETSAMLPAAEPNPKDFKKLLRLKQEMTTFGFVHEIEVKEYWDTYEKLVEGPLNFVPDTQNMCIGQVTATERDSKRNIQNCKQIFEKNVEVDNAEKFIPCVANLGNDFYAVAHPVFKGQLANGIDIYKIPGEFQRTFEEHADSVYDMATTPDGNLAVLATGTTQKSCSVRLFHPVTGYFKSLEDFSVTSPMSFDINLHHQYVILSNEGGNNRKITVFNEDGSEELNHTEDRMNDAIGIACCRKYVNVLTKIDEILVFKFQERKLVLDNNGSTSAGADTTCITATDFHEVTVCSGTNMTRYQESTGDYGIESMGSVKMSCTVPRISVNTGNTFIVMSGGNWIRVYDEST